MSAIEDAAGAAASAVAKPFIPWLILGVVALMAALAGGGFYEGWTMRGDREAANELKIQQAMQQEIDAQRARGDRLAAALEKEKQNIKTVTVEVVKEVPKVVTKYVEKKGEAPKAIPAAIYTNGFVGLWNDSLAARMPVAAGGAHGPAAGSDLVRARIDSADILTNHAVNAGQYAECRAQLNKLIDFEQARTKK